MKYSLTLEIKINNLSYFDFELTSDQVGLTCLPQKGRRVGWILDLTEGSEIVYI